MATTEPAPHEQNQEQSCAGMASQTSQCEVKSASKPHVGAAPTGGAPTPQHEANNAHYALTRAVREMLPKFCKDPDKFAPLLRSEEAIQRLITESQQT